MAEANPFGHAPEVSRPMLRVELVSTIPQGSKVVVIVGNKKEELLGFGSVADFSVDAEFTMSVSAGKYKDTHKINMLNIPAHEFEERYLIDGGDVKLHLSNVPALTIAQRLAALRGPSVDEREARAQAVLARQERARQEELTRQTLDRRLAALRPAARPAAALRPAAPVHDDLPERIRRMQEIQERARQKQQRQEQRQEQEQELKEVTEVADHAWDQYLESEGRKQGLPSGWIMLKPDSSGMGEIAPANYMGKDRYYYGIYTKKQIRDKPTKGQLGPITPHQRQEAEMAGVAARLEREAKEAEEAAKKAAEAAKKGAAKKGATTAKAPQELTLTPAWEKAFNKSSLKKREELTKLAKKNLFESFRTEIAKLAGEKSTAQVKGTRVLFNFLKTNKGGKRKTRRARRNRGKKTKKHRRNARKTQNKRRKGKRGTRKRK